MVNDCTYCVQRKNSIYFELGKVGCNYSKTAKHFCIIIPDFNLRIAQLMARRRAPNRRVFSLMPSIVEYVMCMHE